jgi:hypothetical protein
MAVRRLHRVVEEQRAEPAEVAVRHPEHQAVAAVEVSRRLGDPGQTYWPPGGFAAASSKKIIRAGWPFSIFDRSKAIAAAPLEVSLPSGNSLRS